MHGTRQMQKISCRKERSVLNVAAQSLQKNMTSWMSGLTQVFLMQQLRTNDRSCTGPLISIWRAPISTEAGFSPAC